MKFSQLTINRTQWAALWVIVAKEVVDNLRDKRSLFFALIYGPVLMPLLMVGPLLININKHDLSMNEPKALMVHGLERAPNLADYLARHKLRAEPAPDDYLRALEQGQLDLVLQVPEEFGDQLQAGNPAGLIIHYDSARDASNQSQRQLESALQNYARQLRQLRYLARGLDPALFEPLAVRSQDLSDRPEQLKFIAHLIPFLLLLSMMMGGFYLAVDTTAGERDRQSLEPLLSLPLSRFTLVLGKYLALLCFVLLSLILPLISSFVLFSFGPPEAFGHSLNLGWSSFWVALMASLPLAFMLSAFLLAIAAFARDTKEAQTHLGVSMLLPMLPFFALQYMSVPRDATTMLVPVLSQFQIMELAVVGNPVPGHYLLNAALGALALILVFLAAALHLYKRESILQ